VNNFKKVIYFFCINVSANRLVKFQYTVFTKVSVFLSKKRMSKKDITIDRALRATWQAVIKMYNEQAAKLDSTMATGFALLSIDPEEGTPSTALGPRMGMEATSLSRTLKSMEERGLIERKPNPADGRGVLIFLTEFGKENRDFSKDRVLKFNEAVRANIDAEKVDHFFEVIHVINDLIQNKKIYNTSETTIKQ
jgi:DNA-binding MarR family transcriptional regulator